MSCCAQSCRKSNTCVFTCSSTIWELQGSGLEPLFPLWQISTQQLSRDMIAAGVKAKITCVDPSNLAKSFAGRDYDLPLLQALPAGVDPCGENGEFHTFVYDAPVFSRPIGVQTGEVVERDGFVFADLLPDDRTSHPRKR